MTKKVRVGIKMLCCVTLLCMGLLLSACDRNRASDSVSDMSANTEAVSSAASDVPLIEYTLLSPTPQPAVLPTVTPSSASISVPSETPDASSTFSPAVDTDDTKSDMPSPTPFTVVWMTDTQNYSRDSYKDIYFCMRDWILNNRVEKNIVFMVHTGDIVDGFSETTWQNASDALLPILDVMPGAFCSGNHDVAGDGKKYSYFFNRDYVQKTLQNGDIYMENQCYYTTFSAGGDRFIVFSLGFEVSSLCFDWVRRVMDENPDAICIFLNHHGIESNGQLIGPAKNFLKLGADGYTNAKLMLCGHVRGTAFYRDTESLSQGTVMMFNYQNDRKNGAGFLRLLTFYPDTRNIEVTTYSPYLDKTGYYKTPLEKDCFTIENAY